MIPINRSPPPKLRATRQTMKPPLPPWRRPFSTWPWNRCPTVPSLRNAILDVRRSYEQTIDEVSKDAVLFAGHSEAGREQAAAMISSFREYIEEHKDDIRALQVLYSRPYTERLTFKEVKELAKAIERPPRQWTPEKLWHAYEMLDKSKVRGSGGQMLTDIVSLVRFTLQQDDELVPFRDQVEQRFSAWLSAQDAEGRVVHPEQLQWLTWMKDASPVTLAYRARILRLHTICGTRRHRQGRCRSSAIG